MDNKCMDCEFCFPNEEFGYVCAGDNYGEDISKTLDFEKDCYSESLDAFIDRTKREEIKFIPGTTLAQIKIDGRKQIMLVDKAEKTIKVKSSRAKELFGQVVVLKMRFDEEYIVDVFFNKDLFKNGNYLIIK